MMPTPEEIDKAAAEVLDELLKQFVSQAPSYLGLRIVRDPEVLATGRAFARALITTSVTVELEQRASSTAP